MKNFIVNLIENIVIFFWIIGLILLLTMPVFITICTTNVWWLLLYLIVVPLLVTIWESI